MRPAAKLVNPDVSTPRTRGHVTASVVNAYSSRGGRTGGPLLHASPYPPVPYTPSGATYRALCGAQVKNVTRVEWASQGPGRHCATCIDAAAHYRKSLKSSGGPADV